MNKRFFFTTWLLVVAFLITACASTVPQPRAFETAEAVIEQAERIGAEEYAPTELTHARERLAEARSEAGSSKFGNSGNANYLIEQAEINAELAIARSQVAIARDRVNQKRSDNGKLLDSLQKTYSGEFE